MKRSVVVRTSLIAGASTLAIALISSHVVAQSVNYRALEDLYGEAVTTTVTGKCKRPATPQRT